MQNTLIYSLILSQKDWVLGLGGLVSGLLAGLLGIGGGNILVPILIFSGCTYAESVATSSLAIVLTSVSGTWQNWRMGYLRLPQVLTLGLPGVLTALAGAALVTKMPTYVLKGAFGLFLWLSIYLSAWRHRLSYSPGEENYPPLPPWLARLLTGGLGGFLAGLFGIGGGAVMVPLQMWLLQEPIKLAIQTSLGVIVITALGACFGHAQEDNVLWREGLLLGIGGLIGAQVSTRFLPKLADKMVMLCFNAFLSILSFYFFYQAWQDFTLRPQ